MIFLLMKLENAGNDVVGATARFGNNEALYIKCLKMFIHDENHANLRVAVEENRLDDVFKISHALKGSSGNLGLTAYFQQISFLSDSLKRSEPIDINAVLTGIESSYKELLDIIGE